MSSPCHENDSEVEHEEVQQCLLQLVTPSPAAQQQQHRATFTAFSNMPHTLPQSQLCSQSPSPSPAPTQHTLNHKHNGAFMDRVEVPMKPPQRASHKTRPHRHTASLHLQRWQAL